MTMRTGLAAAASSGVVTPSKSPVCGVACPDFDTRASTVTLPAVESLRSGNIASVSFNSNFTGQLPVVVRSTATGAPGELTDLASMNSVRPAGTFARNASDNTTSPRTATLLATAIGTAGA